MSDNLEQIVLRAVRQHPRPMSADELVEVVQAETLDTAPRHRILEEVWILADIGQLEFTARRKIRAV